MRNTIKKIKTIKWDESYVSPDDGIDLRFHGWIVLTWGGYPYEIELSRIKTPKNLLGWVAHFGGKSWAEMTPWKVGRFITTVCEIKGWSIHGL